MNDNDLRLVDVDDPPQPDALPSMRQLLDDRRSPATTAGPRLEVYTYLGVEYLLDQSDVHTAEQAFQDHMDACEEYGMDGCEPPAPYCGCSDCYSRAAAGFWLSYVVDAIRRGTASTAVLPPPHPSQQELDIPR